MNRALYWYWAAAPKYQQISTAVLLHQMSALATSLLFIHRTNVAASWTDRPHARRIGVWKLQCIINLFY
jgi:hypothetical protein